MLSIKSIIPIIQDAIGERSSYMPVYEDTTMLGFVVAGDQKELIHALSKVKLKCTEWGLHCEDARVRGGRVCMISQSAINELDAINISELIGEDVDFNSFEDRLEKALYEDQFKSATRGVTRSNQSGRQRHYFNPQKATYAGFLPSRSRQSTRSKANKNDGGGDIAEDIHGIATPTDAQPTELFQKFGLALKNLGNNLGLGTIQDTLKSNGINYKKSNDGLSIIFFVKNATTGADQPIHRITSETLENPNDFQESLLALLDIARGDAPGAFKAKQEQMRDIEQNARKIANAVSDQQLLQQQQ